MNIRDLAVVFSAKENQYFDIENDEGVWGWSVFNWKWRLNGSVTFTAEVLINNCSKVRCENVELFSQKY